MHRDNLEVILPRPPDLAEKLCPRAGVFFEMRTIVFIDGQNLYHLAKKAWAARRGRSTVRYSWPSYNVEKIATTLTARSFGRELVEIRFYTGVPDPKHGTSQSYWHDFWTNKLRYPRRRGVYVYRGRVNAGGQEKGTDVSLAIDLIQATHELRYDCAIIVSQDWDFGPAAKLAYDIARSQRRTIVIESAFPVGPGSTSKRGVPGTKWIQIDKATYDACFDSTDYRPKNR